MTDLTAQTPAQIDAAWAPLAEKTFSIRSTFWSIEAAVRAVASGDDDYQSRRMARRESELPELRRDMDAAIEAERPYRAEWDRRGGWTRAHLVVTNGTGHVHRSTSCSTCYPTTQFSWITDFSGATEQEIVDAAGERACTVCYASAPVELRLDRPTQMFSEDEKRKQVDREERAQKRAEKDAKRLLHPVTGQLLRSVEENIRSGGLREGYEIGKTERGAMNAAISGLSSFLFYGEDHPSAQGWLATADLVAAALVAKNGGEYKAVREDLNARAFKSYKRETGRTVGASNFPEVNV